MRGNNGRLGFSEKDREKHMKEIINKENDWEHVTAASMIEEPIKNVTRKKMAIAIKVMKRGKAAGPSEVCAEMIFASRGWCDRGTLPTRVRLETNAR